MSSKRTVALGAVLLVLLGTYIVYPYTQDPPRYSLSGARPPAPVEKGPLPAANGLSNLRVALAADGRWYADLDYAYTGEPRNAWIRVFQVVTGGGNAAPIDWQVGGRTVVPGTHHYRTEVFNPNVHTMYVTEKVFAQLDVAPGPAFAKVGADQRIQWPDPVKVEVEQALTAGKPEVIVEKAVAMIDSGEAHQLQGARTLLQALVEKSPNTDAAYVELARIAMKTQWNSDGLRNAEALIGSALQIRPDSANAMILLGYVYSHQSRHKEAEKQFAEAAKANPPNLYLWANWGDLLVMEGKNDAAIRTYREGIARPPTRNTYDRARWDIYARLMGLLEARQDLDGVEALHRQRAGEYPTTACFGMDYARFMVLQRGDTGAAQAVMQAAPSPDCDESHKRFVSGLAHYVTWSQAPETDRPESLRQARAFQPVSPLLFYTLASSERGLAVIKQLLAAGEKLGMQDNQQLDALTYALRNREGPVARRLLRLGANPVAEIGPEKMPAALIPVITRDLDGIRMMQRAGVDYARLRYQDTTAVDHARQQGDTKLLQLLDPKGGKV
jgi:tetratricopeptide (TPR) repeat protein